MSKQRPLFVPRGEYRSFTLSIIMTTFKMMVVLALLASFALGGVVMGIAKAWIESSPQIDNLLLIFNAQPKTSIVYDRNGNVITEFRSTENRIYVNNYEEFGDNLINAVIAVEDSRFWSHSGVDLKRYVGALVGNVLSGNNQGGSTITCQLIKQTILSDEQTYRRKVQEAYLALQLEQKVTEVWGDNRKAKEQILMEYLNVVYMGGSLYGVKTAAMEYFDQEDLTKLTPKQCAMLARMIKNPSRYNPRSNYYIRNTPEVSEEGANYVLGLMYEQGYLSESEYLEGINEKLVIKNKEENGAASSDMYDHAYYVEYAIYDVITKMLREKRLEDNPTNRSLMENELRTGGYQIYTCLDPEVQDAVQTIIRDWGDKYPRTRYASDKYKKTLDNGSYIDVIQPQAACAVMDWHTGELIAIVGGRNEPTARKQLNRAYQTSMPVGSSIKPLSVYGPAFDMGYSPNTPVLNLPIPINGWDSETGYPTNYNGGSYNGVESMRTAINKSHNYSTAQALFEYVGISNSVNYLLRLGISAKHIQATGSGLALGSSGISVIEMADAFGAIANLGEYRESYAFSEVLKDDGSTYMKIQEVQQTWQVFKKSTAWLLVDVLSDCVTSKGTGDKAVFGNFDNTKVEHSISGKTGTNSDACGVFFAGMTAYYSCAVWIGHDNYKPLVTNATGGTYAAPLWKAIMEKVHQIKGKTQAASIIPSDYTAFGLVRAEACAVSGMRPVKACYNDNKGYKPTTDYYLNGTQPREDCNMHIMVTICTRSNRRATANCSSTKTVGVIYIPQGHPLRMAQSLADVQRYFPYATATSPYPQCTTCR